MFATSGGFPIEIILLIGYVSVCASCSETRESGCRLRAEIIAIAMTIVASLFRCFSAS